MRKMMDNILRRYGIEMQLVHWDKTMTVKAFFQSQNRAEDKVTPLGIVPQGRYLYIGPAGQEIFEDDQLIIDGTAYLVTRAEAYRDGKGIVYRWAVCKRKGGEDHWAK